MFLIRIASRKHHGTNTAILPLPEDEVLSAVLRTSDASKRLSYRCDLSSYRNHRTDIWREFLLGKELKSPISGFDHVRSCSERLEGTVLTVSQSCTLISNSKNGLMFGTSHFSVSLISFWLHPLPAHLFPSSLQQARFLLDFFVALCGASICRLLAQWSRWWGPPWCSHIWGGKCTIVASLA